MNAREYNKIFVKKNSKQGSEKILLGYNSEAIEIVLHKDKETVFHVPYYTTSISLANSTLINDGAKGGQLPADSDRIYQNRKGYGDVTANGNTLATQDGSWFCSWLYRDPNTNTLQWLDRYFNSNISLKKTEFATQNEYILKAPLSLINDSNDVIYDIPSTIVLEPGVEYRYYHCGEQTAQKTVNTFAGNNDQNLLFKITNWSTFYAQLSNSYQKIFINVDEDLYKTLVNPSTYQFVLSSALSFNNNYNISCYLNWNPIFSTTINEFTLGGWIQSNNWSQCPSTQLFGNYTQKGGFGFFVETLNTYPYFVIGETTYGHIILMNQDIKVYADQNLYFSNNIQRIPTAVAFDSNNNLYICTNNSVNFLTKLDSLGNIIGKTDSSANIDFTTEPILDLLCDRDNSVILITTKAAYYFDEQLNFQKTIYRNSLPTTVVAFSYDTTQNTYELNFLDDALDAIYFNTIKFDIKKDGKVYRNDILLLEFDEAATNLQIDPLNRLWVLHGNNMVSVYSLDFTKTDPLFTFSYSNEYLRGNKKISFINSYNRKTNSFEWLSLIQSSDNYKLFVNYIDGTSKTVVDVREGLNAQTIDTFKEDSANFTFALIKGDFTGYKFKRIFNYIKYYNSPQLIFKASLRDKRFFNLDSYKTISASIPINDWQSKIWKFITVVYQNSQFDIYFDDQFLASVTHLPFYELSLNNQPPFFIGSPVGVSNGLNVEIGSVAEIFNGTIGDIYFYNYAIRNELISTFAESKIISENLFWSLPTPKTPRVEKIERMFKHKLPGNKSNFFKIKLTGTGIIDPSTKIIIENQIRNLIKEITPANSELYSIEWIN